MNYGLNIRFGHGLVKVMIRFLLQSANGWIKNTESTSNIHNTANPFVSFIDLQPIRNIYIKSPFLGNFKTVGPTGESDILNKVPVTADFNQMFFDNSLIGNDYLDCNRQTLRTIEFRLTDSAGHEIPFHGSVASFSILFDQMNTNTWYVYLEFLFLFWIFFVCNI